MRISVRECVLCDLSVQPFLFSILPCVSHVDFMACSHSIFCVFVPPACGYNTHRMCLDTVSTCAPHTSAVTCGPSPPLSGVLNGFTFGLPLESQLNGQTAPTIVLQCIAAIDKSIKSPNIYRAAPPAQKLRALRMDLASKQVGKPSIDGLIDILLVF